MIENEEIFIITKLVAAHFGMNINEIIERNRRTEIVKPRQLAQALCFIVLEVDHKEIALSHKMERTTIYNSIKSVSNRRDTQPSYAKVFDKLEHSCHELIFGLRKFKAIKEIKLQGY